MTDAPQLTIAAVVALAGAIAWIIRVSSGMGKLEGRILTRLDAIDAQLRSLTTSISKHEDDSRVVGLARDRAIVDVGQRLARIEGAMRPQGAE
jgi:hypothetical protein